MPVLETDLLGVTLEDGTQFKNNFVFVEANRDWANVVKDTLSWEIVNLDLSGKLSQLSTRELKRIWPESAGLVFCISEGHSSLFARIDGEILSLDLDFTSNKVSHRLKTTTKSDPLIKSLGKSTSELSVLDLTAGLGGDSLVMAKYCKQVIAIENNPIVFLLLADALQNSSIRNMQVINFDSNDVLDFLLGEKLKSQDVASFSETLSSLSSKPDIVYLDPMFPETKKSALPNKEMQILRRIIGPQSDDVETLLEKSLKIAKNRVLIKRPLKSPPIKARPDSIFEGKSFRIDMYLTRA